MLRQWTALAVSTAALTALIATLSLADEDSELHKKMEKVQAANVAITKGTRNSINFMKQQQDVIDNAKKLAKLAKESRPFDEPAKKQKQSFEKWTKIMDEFEKSSEALAEVAAEPEVKKMTREQIDKALAKIKKAHSVVKKTCADCHKDFRSEEEEKF